MRRFLMIVLCSASLLANAQDCKPVVKEYPSPKDLNKYPIESRITPDLSIRIPVPIIVAPVVSHFVYDKDRKKVITFYSDSDKDFREVFDVAFCLKNASNNDITLMAKGLVSGKEVIEFSQPSNSYKAFVTISKQNDELFKYNVYILPQTKINDVVREITLINFSKKEAEEILGTLRITGD